MLALYNFGHGDLAQVCRHLCVSRPGLGEEWRKGGEVSYASVRPGVALPLLDISTVVSWWGFCRMLLIQTVCSLAYISPVCFYKDQPVAGLSVLIGC